MCHEIMSKVIISILVNYYYYFIIKDCLNRSIVINSILFEAFQMAFFLEIVIKAPNVVILLQLQKITSPSKKAFCN